MVSEELMSLFSQKTSSIQDTFSGGGWVTMHKYLYKE